MELLLADINADIVRPPILGLLKASLARRHLSSDSSQVERKEGRKEGKINGEEAPLGRSSIHSALPLAVAVAVGRSPYLLTPILVGPFRRRRRPNSGGIPNGARSMRATSAVVGMGET